MLMILGTLAALALAAGRKLWNARRAQRRDNTR